MTREEAIAVLQLMMPTPCRADGKSTTHTLETIALAMAIKALEQTEPEKCGDCISRQALLESLKTDCSLIMFDSYGNFTFAGERIIEAIKGIPSVEPERKTGKWIPVYDDNGRCYDFRCSACNGADEYGSKFCPNCGADMRGGEKDG